MMKEPSPSPLFTLRGDMDGIHSLLFHSSDGSEYLYASNQSGIIHKWDLQKCREVGRVEVGKEACLAVRHFQNHFVSQSKGGEIKIWEEVNEEWKLKYVFNTDYMGFCKMEQLADTLACPDSCSKVQVISLEGKLLNTIIVSEEDYSKCGEIMALKSCSLLNSEFILIMFESCLICLFDSKGTKVSDFKISSGCPMAVDVDGESKIIIGTSEAVITGLELKSDFSLVKWKEVVITNPGVGCVAIRPDRKLFAAGCWDTRIRLFSMKSFKLLAVLQNHSQTILDVRYSPGKVNAWDCQWLLAAAGQDGRITLWDIY